MNETIRDWVVCVLTALLLCCYSNTATAQVVVEEKTDSSKQRLLDMVKELSSEVEKVRKLKFKDPVKAEVKTPDEVRTFMEEYFEKEVPESQWRAREKAFAKLGLLPGGMDLKQQTIDMLTEEVAGFYDPKTKMLYIVEGVGKRTVEALGGGFEGNQAGEILDKSIAVHELTHALQDQTFDLEKMPLEEMEHDDLVAASYSLFEGGGLIVMMEQMLGMDISGLPDFGKVLGQTAATFGGDTFRSAPAYLRERLIFPYSYGSDFVKKLKVAGGWKLVDQAYTDLPVSTEQIMHFDKYAVERDMPMEIELPDLGASMGPGWKQLHKNVLGEFGISVLLKEFLGDSEEISKASEGWDGDRLVAYVKEGTDEVALVWFTTWDSEEDAKEFASAYASLIQKKYPDTVGEKRNVGLEVKGLDVVVVDGIDLSPAIWKTAWKAKKSEKEIAVAPADMIKVTPDEAPAPQNDLMTELMESLVGAMVEDDEQPDTFKDPKTGLEVTKPSKDWRFMSDIPMVAVMALHKSTGATFTVAIQPTIIPMDLKMQLDMASELMKSQLEGFSKVEGGPVKLKWGPGYSATHEFNQMGTSMRIRQIISYNGPYVVVISCTDPGSNDTVEKDFKSMLDSVKFGSVEESKPETN